MTVQQAEVQTGRADRERGRNDADEDIRAKTRRELDTLDDTGKGLYAIRALNELLEEKSEGKQKGRAETNKEDLLKARGQISLDNNRYVKIVNDKLEKLLVASEYLSDRIIAPEIKAILAEFNRPQDREKLVLIAPLITELLARPSLLQLSALQSQTDTDFESKIRALYKDNADAGRDFLEALIGASHKFKDPKQTRDRAKEIQDQEKEKRAEVRTEGGKDMTDDRVNKKLNDEYRQITKFFEGNENKEQLKLIDAIYGKEEEYWEYFKELYSEAVVEAEQTMKEDDRRRTENNKPLLVGEARETKFASEAHEIVSYKFLDKVRRLIAQLHRQADETDFRVLWEQATSRGNYLNNIKTVTDSFMRRLSQIQNYQQKPAELRFVDFYRHKQQEREETVMVRSRSKVLASETIHPLEEEGYGKAIREERHKLIYPHTTPERLRNFFEYMKVVQNAANSEIHIRRFLHDARAMPYTDRGRDSSYWQELLSLTKIHFDAAEFDNYSTLADAEEIFAAAQTWSKLNEIDYASANWKNLPLTGLPDEALATSKVDERTKDYLIALLKKRGLKDWEIERILAAGIGDNFGITLSAITQGASADPALNDDGSPSLQSYGKKDALIYEALNYLAHVSMRWDSETQNMSGLLWLPIEGTDLKSFAQSWDYRKLIDEKNKAQAAFIAGKNPDDVDEKILRLVDVLNIGKVGSIYDQGGWREFYGYEGWLIRKDRTKSKNKYENEYDILESWKAVENIGVEVLKDYIGNIKKLTPDFYKDNDSKKAERKSLVKYIYNQYFVDPESTMSAEQIDAAIEAEFEKLELEGPDLKRKENGFAPKKSRDGNYNTFFYRTLARAIAQRIPTKYIRMEGERTRKVSGLRDRAWDRVFDLSLEHQEFTLDEKQYSHRLSTAIQTKWDTHVGHDPLMESYQQALRDVAFGEVLLRRAATKKMKDGIKYNDGKLSEVNLGKDYILTPQRLIQLWKDENIRLDDPKDQNDEIDRNRKLNALAVLKASRKFAFEENIVIDSKGNTAKYVDDFASKYKDGAPYGPSFAVATEELERSMLAHRASGLNMPARAIADIVEVEQDIVKPLSEFYSTLKKTSIAGKQDFSDIVSKMSQIRSVLSGMHGTEYSNRVTIWLAKVAIAFFKKNTDAENIFTETILKKPFELTNVLSQHSSMASFIAGGEPGGVWEWDRATIFSFITELSKRRMVPKEPYKSQKDPTMEDTYAVDANGNFIKDADGKLVLGPKKRKADFENDAWKLADEFIGNPFFVLLHRLAPMAVLLILAMFVASAVKGYQDLDKK